MRAFPNSGRVAPDDPLPPAFRAQVAAVYEDGTRASRSRADWYGLFSGVCHRAMAEELLAAFTRGGLADRAAEVVGEQAAAEWSAFAVAPDLETARLDFAALLKAPGGRYVTPNESVWSDTIDIEGAPRPKGLLMGPSTVDMKERWARIGLEPSASTGELPDYLGLELHFLECLCRLEAEAWAAGDEARARHLLDQQRAFLDDHLSRWVRLVCAKIEGNAHGAFFRGFGRVLPAFVRQDRELLGELLAAG